MFGIPILAAIKMGSFWLKIAPYLAATALLVGVYLWIDHRGYQRGFHKRDAEVSALTTTISNFKAASIAAQAKNAAHVATVETAQAKVTEDHQNDYPKQLADARAALAAYVRLHPGAPAYPSYPSKDGLSEIPLTTGQPDAADPTATVPVSDLDACAKSYVVATGLQGWIRDQAAIDRSDK